LPHNELQAGIFLSIPSLHRHGNLVDGAVQVLGLKVAVHLGDRGRTVLAGGASIEVLAELGADEQKFTAIERDTG